MVILREQINTEKNNMAKSNESFSALVMVGSDSNRSLSMIVESGPALANNYDYSGDEIIDNLQIPGALRKPFVGVWRVTGTAIIEVIDQDVDIDYTDIFWERVL